MVMQAQVRLHHRYRHLTEHGKRSTVVNVAIARQLVGFLSAAMTNQPLTSSSAQPQKVAASPDPQPPWRGAGRPLRGRPEDPRWVYAISTRDAS